MARLAFFVGGILMGVEQQQLLSPLTLALILALVVALVRLRRCVFSQLVAALVVGFVWLSAYAHWQLRDVLAPQMHRAESLCEGLVTTPLQANGQRWRFEFLVERCERDGQWQDLDLLSRIAWYRPPNDLQAPRGGERWRLHLKLKQPRASMNPGAFDYETWLFQQGFKATGYVSEVRGAERLAAAPFYSLAAMRERLALALAPKLPDSDYAGVIPALVLADRSGMSAALWQRFQAAGTAHLLAISGLHVGLVAGLGALIGRLGWYFFGWRRGDRFKWMAVAGLVAAAVYAALAGFSTPTVRALSMLCLAAVSLFSGQHRRAIDTLLWVFFGLLLLNPLSVLSAGFWLSFGSVTAIVLGLQVRAHWRPWQQVLWVNGVLGLVLAPLSFALFAELAWWCSAANLLLVPVFSFVVVPLSLLGALLAVTGLPGAAFLFDGATRVIALLNQWQQWLLAINPPELALSGLAPWGLLFVSAALLAPALWRGASALCVLLAALLIQLPRVPSVEQAAFNITALDVGHGLAVLVETRHHVLVYDTGPRYSSAFDSGRAIVAPALREAGWRRPDMIVLSHDDRDHAGGLSALQAIYPGVPLRRVADGSCVAGQSWTWDGVRFEVLHPRVALATNNDNSCVVRVSSVHGSALLSGDIERRAERQMLVEGRVRRSDLLLVPHHGSNSSSSESWLTAVAPEIAIISVDRDSRWGMPHAPVLARLKSQQVRVFSTAESGAISVQFDASTQSPHTVLWRRRLSRFWHLP